MRRLISIVVVGLWTMGMFAVPAKREWQIRTQPDGSTIEIMLVGDEFYHYMINRAGQQVRQNTEGWYEIAGEAPTAEQASKRRAKNQARRQRQEIGLKPNLAPKGVVILANFKDSEFKSYHKQPVFDSLCNALNCKVNDGHPSAAQYFADQSNGTYRPIFDVFGPVDLSRKTAYYGTDNPGEDEGDDQHAADAVVEACRLANQQFTINWADYDSDEDGYVDFVYLIYAGKGQADGGDVTTIWPHNWYISSARQLGYCTYTQAQCVLDGKEIDNYACSAELSGSLLGGIGTLCHEFSHVLGLPDLYDTSYKDNYKKSLTPNTWNIMDQGSYNGNGHCPPNYDPWEKTFFGWTEPVNIGVAGRVVENMKANGEEGYKTYQINYRGEPQGALESGVCYYLENRQQEGWDSFVPGHGLLVWRVNYSQDIWTANTPNHTETPGSPLYTVVSASGTEIGRSSTGGKNTFPGEDQVDNVTLIEDRPITDIIEENGMISFVYVHPYTEYEVHWIVEEDTIETQKYSIEGTDDLELPDAPFDACEDTRFIGWTTQESWCDPFRKPDDLFTKPKGQVRGPQAYHAVFE